MNQKEVGLIKKLHERLLAALLLCIPGVLAIIGWTRMREALFNFFAGQPFPWLAFGIGLILFLVSLTFIGGFIFRHDQKRKRVQAKWIKK